MGVTPKQEAMWYWGMRNGLYCEVNTQGWPFSHPALFQRNSSLTLFSNQETYR
jgi:hypothetical protein